MVANGAIIFDMDGVLVDSEIHWKTVQSEFLRGLIPCWNEQDQQSIIGMSAHDVYLHLVDHYGLEKSKSEYFGFYDSMSRKIYGELSALLPGARELLVDLSRTLPVALASASPHGWIRIVVERFSLAAHLKVIVSADDVNGKGKPHPDIYLEAATRLHVAPGSCLAFEDTRKGVASAKAAGIRCVGVRNGFNDHQDLSAADREIIGFRGITASQVLGWLCQ